MPIAKKSMANQHKEHDVEKYNIVADNTELVYLHSFRHCWLSDLRNPAKF